MSLSYLLCFVPDTILLLITPPPIFSNSFFKIAVYVISGIRFIIFSEFKENVVRPSTVLISKLFFRN